MGEFRRKTEPLSRETLKSFEKAADQCNIEEKLVGHIIPYTGMKLEEFTHMSEDWIRSATPELKVGEERPEDKTPDRVIIEIPNRSQCTGTLRIKPGGRGQLGFERRQSPCGGCNDDYWEPNRQAQPRKIPVVHETALSTLDWWFSQYDSIPLPPKGPGTIEKINKICDKADISRDITPQDLRDTYGTLLVEMGFSSEEIAEVMGLQRKYLTRHLFQQADTSIDWNLKEERGLEREELIGELLRVADEIDRLPTYADIQEHSKYSYQPFHRKFGGLPKARKEAGLQEAARSTQKIPREKLLQELHRLSDELGHPPRCKDIRQAAEFPYGAYRRRFGGLPKAREEAGLE